MKTKLWLTAMLFIAGVVLSSCSGPGYGHYGHHMHNGFQQEAGGW